MIEKNGSDFCVDDPGVWARVVEPNLKRTRRVYGIGSSDINYVVTRIASSSSGVTQSDTQRLSQQKIHELEVQMEAERRARQELEEEIRRERQEQHEMQQQMKELKNSCSVVPLVKVVILILFLICSTFGNL